jgi:hypothetical protein
MLSWQGRYIDSVWVAEKYMPGENAPPHVDSYYGAPHIKTPKLAVVAGTETDGCISTGKGSWSEKIYYFLPDFAPASDGNEI